MGSPINSPWNAPLQTQDYKKTIISSASAPAAQTILLVPANPARKAFSIYNNSTNSLYVGLESDVSGGNQIGQCASNAGPTAHFYSAQIGACPTQELYGRRNTGTGSIIVYEFE